MFVPIDQIDKSVERFESFKNAEEMSSTASTNAAQPDSFESLTESTRGESTIFSSEESGGRAKTRAPISPRERAKSKAPHTSAANAAESAPAKTAANILTPEQNLEKRKEMLESVAPEPVKFAYERAIGKNDSVYSNFCELIMLAKQKIGRIVVKDGIKPVAYATGFMVSERLMLTNWHVFNKKGDVGESEVEFVYELNIFGRPSQAVVFKLATDDFFCSVKELDYCLVAVEPTDVTGSVQLNSFGYHYLDPALGKLGEEGKELLNIIHHPDGDYKQISIRENRFTKILDKTIWYETDTAQGSSGSPVFNDQWQVVALHHMGVPRKSADGKNYLDKDGNIIPIINGGINVSKVDWIANEGVRISVLLADVFATFPDDNYVQGLKKKSSPQTPPSEIKSTPPVPALIANPGGGNEADRQERELKAVNHETKGEETDSHQNKTMEKESSDNIKISIPASLMEATGNISINISNKPSQPQPPPMPPADAAKIISNLSLTGAIQAEDLLEAKKIDTENAVDYSDCHGYNPNFLGVKILIPTPKASIRKYVAKLKNTDKSILDYYYFSTIHHSVRKMPMVSAINVDGNQDLRKDKTERVDVWLRDNRLDYEMQLDDKFYASSGFDKGHMSRREDADWGTTPELAKKFADMTCVYTNACPQVPALNRSNKSGLWGKLEKVVLEKGVDKEHGKSTKISVLNGPIFSSDDRFYKGVQIPMEFWKIILWFGENGKLKATAFKLSQDKLVADMSFEKLGFDSNAEFSEYRCSIKSLEKATSLDFSAIEEYDTFTNADEDESLKLSSDADFEKFVNESYTA